MREMPSQSAEPLLRQAISGAQVQFVAFGALVLVAAPEGIALMDDRHPAVDIYTASIDSHLNEHGYIIPGLGDAGDKNFGTRHN